MITYEVVASDPEGSALSFSWTDNAGGLGTPVSGASSSRITWTAPSCVRASAPPTITATVTNAFHLTATQSFSVTGLPVCPPPSWASTGSLLTAEAGVTSTLLINGKVLVTGVDYASSPAPEQLYDPASGTWSATDSMGGDFCHPFSYTATRLQDGRVLVSGGYCGTKVLYDADSGTWSATGSIRTPRSAHSATLLPNGKVLVAGGYDGNSSGVFLETAEVYDPASGTWSATGSMSWRRTYHTATLLPDGRVLVVGGTGNHGSLLGADVYDPALGTWSAVGSMSTSRFGHTATLLPNGKVLIAGGSIYHSDSGYLASAEVFDPASNTFSIVGSMASPRRYHTATLLHDGRVLVAGGSNVNGSLATAEEYDPASGTWSTAPSMTRPRAGHRATRLLNGQVLIVGGVYTSGIPATAELYTP